MTGQSIGRVAVATAMYLAVHGCTSGHGGAAELSWRLRPASSSLPDKFVDCSANNQPGTGPVTRIRLDWEVDGSPGSDAWACGDNHGVTGFDLPPGLALLSVKPECEDGPADPATYIAPAPHQRDVVAGETISLGAIELVLQVSDCGRIGADGVAQKCICGR